ncbi:hypothetical protein [Pseudomonas sp.]|uniref:hypothetical protein n=1 Tax=Pseudomonas sp. TaxID=306 RepID=UPI003D6E108D
MFIKVKITMASENSFELVPLELLSRGIPIKVAVTDANGNAVFFVDKLPPDLSIRVDHSVIALS